MTDESKPTAEEQENPVLEENAADATALATEEEPGLDADAATKLAQEVDIQDVGPCKKHIKVTIDRSSIDECLNEKFSELVKDAIVPGFRKGKAPRRVIERQFQKEVADQVRGQLLMASLEQLADDFDVAPLAPPNINPAKIEIPKSGPLVYEFDVEVRPSFDLPDYKNLKLQKPVKEFTDADIDREQRRLLSQYGQLVPKEEGVVEADDVIIVDMETKYEDKVIGQAKELTLRVDNRLAFKDGVAEKFAEQVKGAKAGETRTVDITMSSNVATQVLVGKTVQAILTVQDVKSVRLPELTPEFLRQFGVSSETQLREEILAVLERRLAYRQRQSAREQILQHIDAAATWELPQDLLARQARRSMNRRAMEMQEAGIPTEEINSRLRVMQQDILQSTAASLKEFFVLQKIAEEEKIEVSDEEIQREIEDIALQSDESPRRVRARLERDNEMDTLAAMIIEQKALKLILDSAEYEEVPLDKDSADERISVSEGQAVEGELHDPTANIDEESTDESSESENA